MVNMRCDRRDDDVPLAALTQHLIMGTTEREFASEKVFPFDEREARHTVMRAKLDGVPLTYDIFVMKKDGCVYDLVFVARDSQYARGADAFHKFVSGFHAIRRAS